MKELSSFVKSHYKNIILGLFLLLLAIGLYLRLYEFEGFTTFLGDQGRDAWYMKRILFGEEFPQQGPPSSIGMIRLGPLYYYLLTPFLLLFAFNPIGVAYGTLILTIAGMIAAFFALKKEINPYVALFFTFFVVFAAQLIDVSRYAWNPNLLPFAAFFTLFFAYRLVTYRKAFDGILMGVFFSIATQLHHLGFLLGVPLLFFIGYYLATSKYKTAILKNILFAAAAFLILYAPFLSYEFEGGFPNTNKFISYLQGKEEVYIEKKPFTKRFLETNQSFVQNIVHKEITPIKGVGMIAIVLALSIFVLRKYNANSFITLNVMSITTYLLFFSLLHSDRHPHYYASVYLSFFLVIAYLISSIRMNNVKYALTAIMVVLFVYVNLPKYYYFKDKPSHQIAFAKQVTESFKDHTMTEPIRIAALPATHTHEQYRYFVDLQGVKVLPYSSLEKAAELYVICIEPTCAPVDDPIWPITSFAKYRKLGEQWKVKIGETEVTVYQVLRDKSNIQRRDEDEK